MPHRSSLGVVQYLVKPINRVQLEEAMVALGPHVRTVLVCDDEPDILRLFLRMLVRALPMGIRSLQPRLV